MWGGVLTKSVKRVDEILRNFPFVREIFLVYIYLYQTVTRKIEKKIRKEKTRRM